MTMEERRALEGILTRRAASGHRAAESWNIAVETLKNVTHENAESGNRDAPVGDPCGVVVNCISSETQIEHP